ncbi:hypothetical protein OH77DRAFT_761814 [Trametes cingulata]|nr:hypothetical protein OH77DRAFT_761814 [Trametes cingulata]
MKRLFIMQRASAPRLHAGASQMSDRYLKSKTPVRCVTNTRTPDNLRRIPDPGPDGTGLFGGGMPVPVRTNRHISARRPVASPDVGAGVPGVGELGKGAKRPRNRRTASGERPVLLAPAHPDVLDRKKRPTPVLIRTDLGAYEACSLWTFWPKSRDPGSGLFTQCRGSSNTGPLTFARLPTDV